MSTKEQFQLTIDEAQRDVLCDLLDRELNSWFEFYDGDLENTIDIENYTCFQVLKQLKWPLEDELELIEKAKKELAREEEKLMITYYVSTHETYNRDYKVEANSKQEAIQLVRDGEVRHYDEDFVKLTIDRYSVKTEKEEEEN